MRYLPLFILFLTAGTSYAQDLQPVVPHLINLQSIVFDMDGNVTKQERVDLTVRILDDENNVVYTEDHSGLPVIDGAINVSVGETGPSGGIPLDVLDPSAGPKFIDVIVGGATPFEIMPISAVPYAMWAEKAVIVSDDSVTSQQIKDGSIKVEDLEPGFSFGNLDGEIADGQIPQTIARIADLNAHANSATAHSAAAITVNGTFVTFVASNVEEALQKLDAKTADEIVNRQTGQATLTTGLNAANTAITGHVAAATAHGSDGVLVGANTLNSAVNGRVSKSGDSMGGNLDMTGHNILNAANVSGVDIASLSATVTTHQTDITNLQTNAVTNMNQLQGQVSEAQVPQSMRPAAYGTVVMGACLTGGMGAVTGYNVSDFQNAYQASVALGSQSGNSVRINFSSSIATPYTVTLSPSPGGGVAMGSRDSGGFNVSLVDKSLCSVPFDFIVFKN